MSLVRYMLISTMSRCTYRHLYSVGFSVSIIQCRISYVCHSLVSLLSAHV
jgi:hypothetical protein